MKKNTTKNADPVAPAVVIPPAYVNHDKTMPSDLLQYGIAVGQKHPDIVNAYTELKEVTGRMGEKYFAFATKVREAKLLKKDATALLQALGFNKNRTSEIIASTTVPDKIWNSYKAGEIGFKATLGAARAIKAGKQPNTKKAPPVIHDVTEETVKAALREAVAVFNKPLKEGEERTEWVFTVTDERAQFYFALTVSPKLSMKQVTPS